MAIAFRPDSPVTLVLPAGRVAGSTRSDRQLDCRLPGCVSRQAGRSGGPGGGGAGCGADEVVGGWLAGVAGADRGGDRAPSAAGVAGHDLGAGGDTAGVDQAEAAEDQHDGGGDERGDGGDAGDGADGAEGVGVEQQAAQGFALEDGGDLGGQLGVSGLGDGFGGQLGVGLAAADDLEVVGDEVVGPDFCLGAGGELLSGVLVHGGEFGGLDGGAVAGGEEDFLGGELVVDLVVDEVVAPQGQCAGDGEGDGEEQSGDGDEDVEGSALHDDRP